MQFKSWLSFLFKFSFLQQASRAYNFCVPNLVTVNLNQIKMHLYNCSFLPYINVINCYVETLYIVLSRRRTYPLYAGCFNFYFTYIHCFFLSFIIIAIMIMQTCTLGPKLSEAYVYFCHCSVTMFNQSQVFLKSVKYYLEVELLKLGQVYLYRILNKTS